MLKLTYIHHDCFLMQTESAAVVFDYYNFDSSGSGHPLPDFLQGIPKDKPLYVIVSHHHKDHFSPQIFGWSRYFENIRFIISADTARISKHYFSASTHYTGLLRAREESVSVLSPGEEFSDRYLTVRGFGSTDIGNSYAIRTEGKTIFHAGDLNAWIWRDESTDEEVAEALREYENVLCEIQAYSQTFDVAMFPVDARIGSKFYIGAHIFTRRFRVGLFIPMHFCLGESEKQNEYFRLAAADFTPYANPEFGSYAALTKRGDAIAISTSEDK